MSSKKKIIFLNYIPSPYRVDFFNELSKVCDLTVVFYYPSMPNAPWQNRDKELNFKHFFLFENKGFIKGIIHHFKFLSKHKNDIIVIGGYGILVEILTIFFLKIFKIDFVLNSDGGFITKGFFKTLLKKSLIKSATYWLSSGANTTKTLEYYGAKSNSIFEYHFSSIYGNEVLDSVLTSQETYLLKKQLNLDIGVLYLIFVGQLINRKGVDDLIRSLKFVKNNKIQVLIIGSGAEQQHLKELVSSQAITAKVHFLGKLSKELVLNYLKISDIFVFPSREDIWGLVLNEAIANGLPIISTNKVGSAYSLIDLGKNGLMVDIDNPILLARAINKLLSEDLGLMKKKSLEIAKEYIIEKMIIDHIILFEAIEVK